VGCPCNRFFDSGLVDTVRCFRAVSLIIEDESIRVPDAVFDAIRPIFAASGDDILLLSTPFGTRGHYHALEAGPDNGWEKITVTADKCPNNGDRGGTIISAGS
jgi:hypothetical protein